MKTQKILFIIVLFFSLLLSASALNAQLTIPLQKNLAGEKKAEIFKKIGTELVSDNPSSLNFYPVNDGDFWEYITADTTTLLGQFYSGLNFSITKEITGDTLMANSIAYKKVKWKNIANSVNYPEWYDYHRVDSVGNVHLFYQDSDYLLFDFSLNIGQSYPAHLPNHIWKITDRYSVIGFGDTLEAIDYELLEQGTVLKEKYTIVENFGIVYYQKNIDGYSLPEGDLWGAVINGEEFGTLIATKQEVDWSKFYPLHIGDYWVYEELVFANVYATITRRVLKDTLMDDEFTYKKIIETRDIPGSSTSFYFERIDSLGRVYEYDLYNQGFANAKYKFSISVGDTAYDPLFHDIFYLLETKFYSVLSYSSINTAIYWRNDFADSLGKIYYEFEGGNYGYLAGAFINGILYGDTTITSVDEEFNQNTPIDYVLLNYPNPFNTTTIIKYNIAKEGQIQIAIYNLLGKNIKILDENFHYAGAYTTMWDGTDQIGSQMPSGVYFVRLLLNDNTSQIRKIILLK